jgi:hypothetical protein
LIPIFALLAMGRGRSKYVNRSEKAARIVMEESIVG